MLSSSGPELALGVRELDSDGSDLRVGVFEPFKGPGLEDSGTSQLSRTLASDGSAVK